MKKFIINFLLPAIFIVLAIVGGATIVVSTCQSCSAKKNPNSWAIQDLTQKDIDTLVSDNEMLNDRLNMAIKQLDAYRDYYLAVEHLLDCAGIDEDSPIIESDAGSTYLDRKWLVDSLEAKNSNSSKE